MSEPQKYGATWGGTDPRTGKPYTWDGGYYYDSPIAPPPNPTKHMLFKIALGFAQESDEDLEIFGGHVFTKSTENAASLPGLTALLTGLNTANGNFHTSLSAAAEGGKSLTIDKNAKREIVIGILRQLAVAIEVIPNITQATAALSGFETFVPGGHHDAAAPDAPVILAITNTGHGQLSFKLQGPAGVRGFELQYTVGAGAPVNAGFFSSKLGIVVDGLTPGTTYAFQACTHGAGNLVSAWSPPVSIMCT